MSIDAENIVRHELIGLNMKIVKAKDLNKMGLSGRIIDETQKTLVIRMKKGKKIIAKKENVFEIKIPSGERVELDGRLIYGRPEDRIKKKLPKKWDVLK
jgi:ribonuclease P protein subunit POP4